MKFEKLGKDERRLLLLALDVPLDNLVCAICGESTNYEVCSILPKILINDKPVVADILCDSILCMCSWLEEYDQSEKYIKE